MPREVVAYCCEFKCGRHATLNRKAVLSHEKTCAKNPARRACKTCAHQKVIKGEPAELDRDVMVYPGIPGGYECSVGLLGHRHAMVFDCPSWAARS
jgi:hypothetical protein